jgi:hypothetical protein
MSLLELTESIDVRLLANLSENFRSPYEALFELVDNGLASRREDRPVVVTIGGSGGVGGLLRVVTKGGRGMGLHELQDFLHWGKQPDAVGLNRFGQGGKAAIGYLARGVRLRANRFDDDVAYQFEDHNWRERPEGVLKRFVPQRVKPVSPGEGVVQVELIDLRKAVNLRRLERELGWRYRPALRDRQFAIRVANTNVQPTPLDADLQAHFAHRVVVPALDRPGQGVDVTLAGWVGIASAGFDGRGGIRCSAHGRVVHQNEYFGHRTSTYKASLNSLVGEVDLSFVPVVLNKNAFDTGSRAWQVVEEIMHHEMAPLVEQLLRRKETHEPSDEERMRAMEASDIARKVLERLASESSARGSGGEATGRKPPTRSNERRQKEAPSQQREAEPRTPPPPGAIGTLRRKGSTVDWDVRALDPHIRSASAVQNGHIEIVINSRYPLYEERRGDLLYMLETGFLEELKPTETDDKTVAEYYEHVTEAVYLGVRELAARGRRGRVPLADIDSRSSGPRRRRQRDIASDTRPGR